MIPLLLMAARVAGPALVRGAASGAGRMAASGATKMGASEGLAARVGSMAESGTSRLGTHALTKMTSPQQSSPSYESRTENFSTGGGAPTGTLSY